jgi:hypothetical protein
LADVAVTIFRVDDFGSGFWQLLLHPQHTVYCENCIAAAKTSPQVISPKDGSFKVCWNGKLSTFNMAHSWIQKPHSKLQLQEPED